jgi:hypothetical protein
MDNQNRRIAFTDEGIETFCRLTGDFNFLHSPEYMDRVHEKRAIVPGIMMLSAFGDSLWDYFAEGVNSIQVCFCDIVSAGENTRFGITNDGQLNLFLDKNGLEKNVFASKDVYSRIYSSNPADFDVNEMQNPSNERIEIERNSLRMFGELMQIQNESVRDRLFALALLSRTLFNRTKSGNSSVDVELREKMSGGEGQRVLPVYIDMCVIYSPEKELRLSHNPVNLETFVRKDDSIKRRYVFTAKCMQDGMQIYSASGGLLVVKEELLARGAMDSTIIAVA